MVNRFGISRGVSPRESFDQVAEIAKAIETNDFEALWFIDHQLGMKDVYTAMNVSAMASLRATHSDAHDGPVFEVEGDDAGLLIGRKGETLRALQFIVRYISSKTLGYRTNLMIDVENYQQKRYSSLAKLTERVAKNVIDSGRPTKLEPMPSNERRVVHMALAEHPEVTTESMGSGDSRQVVVYLKDLSE